MDSDGLPSSYVCKVLACLGKWQTKLIGLAEPLDSRDPSLKPLITKADDVCKSLDSCADRISEVSSVGIASGYTHVSLGYMWSWSKGVTAITMFEAGPILRHTIEAVADGAPMRVLAEKTKALADEHGKSFAKNSVGSLGLSVANANQAFSRVVSKFHFTLKIPIATYVHAEGPATASLPYHSPTQLLSVLLEKYPWLLMGGCDQEECCRQLLLAFWDCYEQEHPEHEIFKQKNRDRLGKTIPLTMHGDGGRTQKKQPLEICSLQPVLVLNSASCASVSCHCPTSVKHGSGQFGDPLRQCLNSKHNTYMTHFLLFAYPSKSYKDFANLLHGLLQCVCDDLAEVCKSGIKTAGGRHYYFASVGFKLDMEWMAKIGSDTVVILKWLAFLLKLHLQESSWSVPSHLLKEAFDGGDAAGFVDGLSLDLATRTSLATKTFTAGYGKTSYGAVGLSRAGPLLYDAAPLPPERRLVAEHLGLVRKRFTMSLPADMWSQVRYFAPKEVANLMGFPRTWSLPGGWRLLGNSVNVSLVAHLMDELQRWMQDDELTGSDVVLAGPAPNSRAEWLGQHLSAGRGGHPRGKPGQLPSLRHEASLTGRMWSCRAEELIVVRSLHAFNAR
ncbi:tRNA (cytosine(38)-C(5))-methyltransferase (DNA (cytosine-5)-methyltransferase-like protein 2) (Dnmt2) (DNA methyltransferase homolog MmuIIP) (DNA MTase homolog MmuIIP) (M.MmuIIP) (Met-2) [Durusdinium trenchii]|uniref:tRNA (Cytosine(38)-C(5))-methyltransferase (DNA (Cytosine-5)-methyltransferase-like protein 2) (Dnmt2) (DNA methyltransferase homolog MmuIIP) (DNA MTase homolog MmuIIP) (M.MmuIIP) (Met-2) n=1 Tax=Durusdinium trenchii TaxID=1381693 RepID=A0ABP0NPP2_9DINO